MKVYCVCVCVYIYIYIYIYIYSMSWRLCVTYLRQLIFKSCICHDMSNTWAYSYLLVVVSQPIVFQAF